MAVLCKPAIQVPEYVITNEETLELARRLHGDHPQLDLILRLIEHTGVQKRHLIQPIETVLQHPASTPAAPPTRRTPRPAFRPWCARHSTTRSWSRSRST